MIALITFAQLIILGSVVFLENRDPTKTIIWLLILGVLPILGALLYLMLGRVVRKHQLSRHKQLLEGRTEEILKERQVNTVIVFRTWKRLLIVVIADRLRLACGPIRLLKGPTSRKSRHWILKLDWSGESKGPLWMLQMGLFLMFSSILFDQTIIESTCGFSKIAKWFLFRRSLVTVPNGYSPTVLARNGLNYFQKQQIVLTVARIEPMKGLHILIRAFAHATQAEKTWALRIVGPTEDMDYFRKLLSLCKELGITERVVFVGSLKPEALADEYGKASIFCSTSLRESFGIARLEAIANGLPVVTTPCGCPEDLTDFGMVVTNSFDSLEFATKLEQLMNNPNLRLQLSEAGKKKARSWDEIIDRFLSESAQS